MCVDSRWSHYKYSGVKVEHMTSPLCMHSGYPIGAISRKLEPLYMAMYTYAHIYQGSCRRVWIIIDALADELINCTS